MAFGELDGTDVSIVNYTRLLWRVQPSGGQWRIIGLRVIYIRDVLQPCNPNRVPKIDDAELKRYRRSYRYLSYMFARTDHPARDDLPGIDRPESVAALRAAEAHWLAEK